MANILEQRGLFWWFNESDLPARSKEAAVPGLLTITDDGRTTLQTDGPLCGNDEHTDWTKPRSFPPSRRIAGLLDTPGDYVLLEDLERTDFSFSDEAPQSQEFTAEYCTKRQFAFPNDYEQGQFTELRVEMTGLEEWLDLDSIVVSGQDADDDNTVRVQVSYKEHRISFPVLGGMLLVESLTTGSSLFRLTDHPRRSAEFKQYLYIIFRPDTPANRQQMQYTFTKIEELLALLLGTYYRLVWPTFVRKEEPFDSWVTIYSQRNAPTSRPLNRYFCWVTFERIREHFGQLFQGWLDSSEAFGAGFYLYIASLRNPHVYSEDRLFSLCSGMEALHRRWLQESESSPRVVQAKERVQRILSFLPEDSSDLKWLSKRLARAHEPNLEARLLECLRQLPIQFAKGELEKFAKACADRRNDISHEGGPRSDMDYSAFHQETSRLAEALDHLFHALLLYKIGLPTNVLFETLTKSWVAERQIKPALVEVGLHIQPPAQSENE
jgi:hypothetical protein